MDFEIARKNMVNNQLRPNGVKEPLLLQAMGEVPREIFLPHNLRTQAYCDDSINLEKGRCMINPVVLGRLIQEAHITPQDLVLIVGCTTGYSSAILGRIAKTVVAIESDPEYTQEADLFLQDIGINNVIIIPGDLTVGAPDLGPFDVILFGGAIDSVPQTYIDQLADKGRLVAVIRKIPSIGKGYLFQKERTALSEVCFLDATIPNLPPFTPKAKFYL